MKAIFTITVAGVLLAGGSAYGQAGAQANADASGSASTQAWTPGAQASGNGAASASASAQAGQNSASLANGTAVNATLSQPIDAKKNKPGDTVTARTSEATKSEGKVVIPKGSKLVGHVTEAKARTKGESESAVGIVFDKAILKHGREVPLNVTLQAVGAAQSAASNSLQRGSAHGWWWSWGIPTVGLFWRPWRNWSVRRKTSHRTCVQSLTISGHPWNRC